ncbi:MAG: hypothetical protein ABW168_24255 [Sedimenticola sp.]
MNRQHHLLPLIGLTLAMLFWGSSFIALKLERQDTHHLCCVK